MADLKITDVPQGSSVASTDEFYIKTGNNFRRVSLTKLFALLTSQGFFSIPLDGIKTTDLAIEKVSIVPSEEGYYSSRTYSQILASEDANFEIQPEFLTNDGAQLRGVVVDITDSEAIFAFLVPGPGPHISVFAVTDLQVTETVIPLFGQPCRAVCNTEEETTAKTAEVQGVAGDLFSLYDGATVYVYFTNGASPGSTLNVNNTGAKPIDFGGAGEISAGTYVQLFYQEALGAWVLVGGGSGITDDIKTALLNWCAHTAWDDTDGQTRYNALYDALYPGPAPVTLVSITANYEQDRPIFPDSTTADIKYDLTVTANYSDGTSEVLSDSDYEISGTLVAGTTCEMTVIYEGKTDTIEVIVKLLPSAYRQVEWLQSDGGQVIETGVSLTGGQQILDYEMECDAAIPTANASTAIIMSLGQQTGCWFGNVNQGADVGIGNSFTFTGIDISEMHTYKMYWDESGGTRYGHAVCGSQELSRANTIVDQNRDFSFFSDAARAFPAKCRIAHGSLTKAGTIIRDLYPAYRVSDNVMGMYDIVNDVFYTNTGTGSFTKGNNV